MFPRLRRGAGPYKQVDAVELANACREVADDTTTKVGDTVGDAAVAASDVVDDALVFGEREKPVKDSKEAAEN